MRISPGWMLTFDSSAQAMRMSREMVEDAEKGDKGGKEWRER